ncbi:hypothetical protein E1B28_005315 [Marasmius oreades]|uniref:Uncharacterized protein n=1 Tax=Marasmius oreades TaxID=181124 RepID=A0A9P8ADV9_9AGAR|nr:uncharacterized protein E1B28_005315 [Marasmius oreades]KAG7098007.1 hypothetical protein E1B28_005315 [Marasmius oreades]
MDFAALAETGAPWSINGDYLRIPLHRFPTASSAFNQLRRLGKPPSASPDSFNVNSPNMRVTMVLHVMGSVTAHLRGLGGGGVAGSSKVKEDIKVNWASHLGPWVEFLLEVAISRDQEPSTPAGVDLRDRTFMFIPGFLDFTVPESEGVADLAFFNRTSPKLVPLLYQTWREIIALSHSTWGMWTTQLSSIFHRMVHSNTILLSSFATKSDPAPQKKDLGRFFISHLNFVTPLLSTMEWHEIPSISPLSQCPFEQR